MWKLLTLVLFPFTLTADISFLLHESTGTGMARWTDAGHAAIYLSRVCVDSAIKLRLCGPGEAGAVVSAHTAFGENQNYEWNAAPLSIYLYGVEDFGDAPLFATPELRRELQERYRRRSLSTICPEVECAWGEGHWRDMAGQLFMRDIYAIRFKTTPEQDQEFIRTLNGEPNVGRFNGFTRNCADFASTVLNRYFPGSARPDHLNDFGMTSPKAIAKSMTKFGQQHPELEFLTEKYSQIQGPTRRSKDNRKGTEVAFHSKKWLLPLLCFHPQELGLMAAAYYTTGRYDANSEYERTTAPLPDSEWDDYRKRFETLVEKALEQRVFSERADIKRFFRELARGSTPGLTATGKLYVQTADSRLYLTHGTILGPDSNRILAYKLLLAKVNDTLSMAKKNRESAADFRATWDLLVLASTRPPV